MNHVVLIGRIANDIRVSKTQSGKSVTSFNIAVNRDKDNTDFIPCVVWNQLADNLVQYCGKGRMIAIAGKIQTRSYETENGQKRRVVEVVGNHVKFLESKKETAQNSQIDQKQQEDYNWMDDLQVDINDDDLPF